MPKLRLMLLGGFQAQTSDSPMALPRKKAQMLLAYLALNPRQAHPRDKLATLLWSDASAEQARHNLRQTLFALRQALPAIQPPLLRNDSEGVSLDIAAVSVDVREFEQLACQGTVDALHHAAELYRGELLEGLSVAEPGFEDWLRAQRERLHELALSALAKLFALHRAAGAADAAIQVGLKLLALDPLEEMIHRELMRMYVAQGRRGAALRQYQICLDVLQREIGAEPEPETKELYRRILPQPSSRAGPPEPASAPSRRRRLPRGLHRRSEALQSEGALIGRESEMTRLRQTLGDAWRGHGRAVVILGEAGVGKTRLIREVAVIASRRDGLILLGRSHESERILAFGPWVEALRAPLRPDVLVGLDEVWRTELGRLFPEVAAPDRPPSPTAESQVRLFEAVAQLVRHLATRHPLLIVLEDVHWADEISLRLLSFLGRRLDGCAVMLVATAREEEIAGAPTLALVLDELDRGGSLARLAVQPLSRADTAVLVRVLAGRHAGAASLTRLAERVWKLSEGNPFMIVETMQSLRDGSAIEVADDLPMPERVRDVIVRSLGRLSDRGRDLVAVAAMIGREFEFKLLLAASGVDADAAAHDVEELVRRRVLHGVGDRFDFVHDRIREVADDQVLAPRRRLLHDRVARAIETVYAEDLAPCYADLGRHYREAQVWDKAATYLREAGLQAVTRSAYREAAAAFSTAQEALDHLPTTHETLAQGVDLRLDLRNALIPLGRHPQILEMLREAERVAQDLGDQFRLARVLSCLAYEYTWMSRETKRALETAERALAVAQNLGDHAFTARAHQTLGEFHMIRGDHRLAAESFRKSAEESDDGSLFRPPVGPVVTGVYARAFLSYNLAALGQFGEAIACAEKTVQLAKAVGQPLSLAYAYYELGSVFLLKGEIDEAIAALERAHEIRVRQHFWLPEGVPVRLGYAYVHAGRAADGLPLIERGVEETVNLGKAGSAGSLALLADTYLWLGRLADAAPLVERALDLSRRQDQRGTEAYALGLDGRLVMLRDRPDFTRGERNLRRAIEITEELGSRPRRAHCHADLGSLYLKWARPSEARRELLEGIAHFRSMAMPFWLRRAEEALASLDKP
jgi:DNA-binding SARP family transcriptional activator